VLNFVLYLSSTYLRLNLQGRIQRYIYGKMFSPHNPKPQIDLKTYEIHNKRLCVLRIKAIKSLYPGLCPRPQTLLGAGGLEHPLPHPINTRFVSILAPNPGEATVSCLCLLISERGVILSVCASVTGRRVRGIMGWPWIFSLRCDLLLELRASSVRKRSRC